MMACRLEQDYQQRFPLAERSPFQDTVAVLPVAQVRFMLVIAMLTASFDCEQDSAAQSLQAHGSLCE